MTIVAPKYAARGSQRWLQVAIGRAPDRLDAALRRAGVLTEAQGIEWRSPVSSSAFCEYRDGAALSLLGIDALPVRSLADFWPPRGPVWDALGVTADGLKILVEAKAHIAEAASPPSKASSSSLSKIEESLEEARRYYAPRSAAKWSGPLYQYANRLAFQFFLNRLNGIPSRVVFLDFCNAQDVKAASEAEWRGATEMIHSLLGIPSDLAKFGVYHAHFDVQELRDVI
jgi:hypothetical protein